MRSQRYTAIATHDGDVIITATTIDAAMSHADAAKPSGEVIIRGEYTSDGAYQGLGRGTMVAMREHGTWMRA